VETDVAFARGDAAAPPYAPASADVVLVRHVLWALPDPDVALARWIELLRPEGRLVLVEGAWSTGAGIAAEDCRALVLGHRREAVVERLEDPALWGRAIDDERYALLSRA
jgi:SAM-dependent methyltransferase